METSPKTKAKVLAAGYSNYEDKSLLDGIYFSASTLSTAASLN